MIDLVPGSVASKCLDLLKEHDMLTAWEMAVEIGTSASNVHASLHRREMGTHGQRWHIHAWRKDSDSGTLCLRRVYKLGPGRRAKRPPQPTHEYHWKKYKANQKMKVNSVFSLGIAPEKRRARA